MVTPGSLLNAEIIPSRAAMDWLPCNFTHRMPHCCSLHQVREKMGGLYGAWLYVPLSCSDLQQTLLSVGTWWPTSAFPPQENSLYPSIEGAKAAPPLTSPIQKSVAPQYLK